MLRTIGYGDKPEVQMIVSSSQKECMVIQFLTDKKEETHWLHKHTDDIYEGLKVPLVIITEDEI